MPALPFCKAALRAQKPRSAVYPTEIKSVGDHLRKKRLDLKMTQKEVAAKLQTNACTYRDWERNQRNPSFRYMLKIIKFLGYIPFDMQFEDLGQRIRAYRQILGLRQKDLARQLAIDPTTIAYLEKGKHKPGKRVARELDGFFSSAARILSQRMRLSL